MNCSDLENDFELPRPVGRSARRCAATSNCSLSPFQQDPCHPSLHYKSIKRRGTVLHSARVGLHYRVLAYENGSVLYWFWIGPHTDFDHLLDRI